MVKRGTTLQRGVPGGRESGSGNGPAYRTQPALRAAAVDNSMGWQGGWRLEETQTARGQITWANWLRNQGLGSGKQKLHGRSNSSHNDESSGTAGAGEEGGSLSQGPTPSPLNYWHNQEGLEVGDWANHGWSQSN